MESGSLFSTFKKVLWKDIISFRVLYNFRSGEKELQRPGIEPGPTAWQAAILPLNHRCLPEAFPLKFLNLPFWLKLTCLTKTKTKKIPTHPKFFYHCKWLIPPRSTDSCSKKSLGICFLFLATCRSAFGSRNPVETCHHKHPGQSISIESYLIHHLIRSCQRETVETGPNISCTFCGLPILLEFAAINWTYENTI